VEEKEWEEGDDGFPPIKLGKGKKKRQIRGRRGEVAGK